VQSCDAIFYIEAATGRLKCQ